MFSASASVIVNEPCSTQLEHDCICACSGCGGGLGGRKEEGGGGRGECTFGRT